MILFGREIFQGEMVAFDAFVPSSRASQIGAISIAVAAAYIANDLNLTRGAVLASVVASLGAGWIYQRHVSRASRGGFFLDKPRPVKKVKADVNFNIELTEHFKSLGAGFENCMVTEVESLQYRVIKVPNTSPAKVSKELDNIAIKMGIDANEIIFNKVFGKCISAFLVPLPKDKWKGVSFDASVLKEGKLLEHVGNDIKGNPVVADRQVEPMCLIFGSTNSGKTEAVRASIHSLLMSSLKPRLFIADPKPDMQDLEHLCERYTQDLQDGLEMFKWIYAEGKKRQAKYNKAGCKNFWEYLSIDPTERPIALYMDELPNFLEKNLDEKPEKDETPFHIQAQSTIRKILKELRSSGVFVTASLQTPKAEIINTSLRDQFGDRRAFNVPDQNASRVGLDFSGAEKLQKFGGMLYFSSMRLTPLLCRSVLIN